MRLNAAVVCIFLLVGCEQEVDQNALLERARSSDVREAYALHERVFWSAVPADDSLAPVVARHGQAARDFAIEKASSGNRDEIHPAIAVIRETGRTLKTECTAQQVAAVRNNLRKKLPSEEIQEGVWKLVAVACGHSEDDQQRSAKA